jgi:glycosyltransferase involved in cell wall biosynthesis
MTGPAPHVGLNLIFLVPGETGGMETYARELLPRLAQDTTGRLTAFVNREAAGVDLGVETEVVPVRASSRLEWVRGEQLLLPRLAERAGVDLLHSLGGTAPGWGRFRRIVTIHDLHYRTVPDAHFGLRGQGMRVLVPLAARRTDRVIAVSRTARDELVTLLRVPEERVDVVPHGVGASARVAPMPEAEVRARHDLGDRPVVLSVSAKRPHKNLMRLLDAHARLQPRPVLVLPGYPTEHETELRRRAEHLGTAADVRFLGWVAPAELEGLYGAASAFVFPSLAEGFGLPVLEAMARGVPVACSGTGAVAEVAGTAALRFDPLDVSAIAAAIVMLLTDAALAERLRAAGRERAAQFTWGAAARGTLASYERALSVQVSHANDISNRAGSGL